MKYFYYVLIIYALSFQKSLGQSIGLTTYTYLSEQSLNLLQDSLITKHHSKKEMFQYADGILSMKQKLGYYNTTQIVNEINDTTYLQKVYLNKLYSTMIIDIPENLFVKEEFSGIMLSRKRNTIITTTKQVDSLLDYLQNKLFATGKLFASLKLTDINLQENDTVTAKILFSNYQDRRIDKIKIKGYDKFPVKNILPRNNLKKVMSQKNINEISTRIKSLPFTNQIKEPELEFKNDSTTIYFYLEKVKSNFVEGFLGFNSENRNNPLTGNLDLRLLNNFDKAEKIQVKYLNNTNSQQEFNLSIDLPYILRRDLGLHFLLNTLRRDTIYQNSRLEVGILWEGIKNNRIDIFYKNQNSTGTQITTFNAPDYKKNGVGVSFENTNQFIQNLNYKISTSISRRKTALQSDNVADWFISIDKKSRISNRLSLLNTVQSSGVIGKNILFNEFVQLGGLNTVRGFAERSIDTKKYFTTQNELQYNLGSNFYIHTITDFGIYDDFLQDKSIKIVGYGLGLGIFTSNGLLKISLSNGRNLNNNTLNNSILTNINYTLQF